MRIPFSRSLRKLRFLGRRQSCVLPLCHCGRFSRIPRNIAPCFAACGISRPYRASRRGRYVPISFRPRRISSQKGARRLSRVFRVDRCARRGRGGKGRPHLSMGSAFCGRSGSVAFGAERKVYGNGVYGRNLFASKNRIHLFRENHIGGKARRRGGRRFCIRRVPRGRKERHRTASVRRKDESVFSACAFL